MIDHVLLSWVLLFASLAALLSVLTWIGVDTE